MITVIDRLRVRMRARLKDTRREGSAEIRTFFFSVFHRFVYVFQRVMS